MLASLLFFNDTISLSQEDFGAATFTRKKHRGTQPVNFCDGCMLFKSTRLLSPSFTKDFVNIRELKKKTT